MAEAEAAAKKLDGAVTILGYADRAGPDTYNQVLSELRADAVAKYMAAGGVPTSLIAASAYGEGEPFVHTDDGVPEAANRRVVIIVEPQ